MNVHQLRRRCGSAPNVDHSRAGVPQERANRRTVLVIADRDAAH